MSRHVIVIMLLILSTVGFPGQIHSFQDVGCHPETGLCPDSSFIKYWERNGGLPVFGYPLTPARDEINRDTGNIHLTQWFERNRLELHPENKEPYDVLLGRLGDDLLRQHGIDWQTLPRESGSRPDCEWFELTGHNACDQGAGRGFKTYWQTHGLQDPSLNNYGRSLALFGLPLTEPKMETNESGDTVLTQWFERARFEWHPDKPEPYDVLLGLLGSEVLPAPFDCRDPKPDKSLDCIAREEGVRVLVPDQGRRVRVENLPKTPNLPMEQTDFKVIRHVINFEVVDAESGNMLETFSQPIRLKVKYTDEDVQKAGGEGNLKLAFYDDKQEKWIIFGSDKHGFHLDIDDELGKVGAVEKIDDWFDRNVCWGR